MGNFGIGMPYNPAQQSTPWATSPAAGQGLGLGISPFGINPLAAQQPFANIGSPGQAIPYGPQQALPQALQQALPQIGQLLQAVPQQIQQVLQLQQIQLQQLQQLQQIVQQVIPAQLQQLQQLIQYLPQQIQQLQQTSQTQQPFGQMAGLGAFTPWGITPPAFGAQPGHVM